MNWMELALKIARQGQYTSMPNPMVGCVIVKNNQIIGKGAHLKWGSCHSEQRALRQAGSAAAGSDVYVTLEPCCHQGKTLPCVDALIQAQVRSVNVAVLDPNPLINGQGITRLREAGIKVTIGNNQDQAYHLNESFFYYITQKIPFVIAKWAMSMDGKIATFTGHSQWITGIEARRHVHEIRHQSGGILVGANTIRHDNPYLTVRHQSAVHQPRPIIITKTGNISPSSHALNPMRNPLVLTSKCVDYQFLQRLDQQKISHYQFSLKDSHLPIDEILKVIAQEGISNVLVEGGCYLLTQFMRSQTINRVYAYMAPKIIGGEKSLSPIAGPEVQEIQDCLSLRTREVLTLGQDICLVADTPITPINYADFLLKQKIHHV